jgi:hypothetical protein
LGKWERRTLSLLARSKAYGNNDLKKLLELVNDIRATHTSQIQFIEKYVDDLFTPTAVKSLQMEREETNFLERKILPFLTEKLAENTSQ